MYETQTKLKIDFKKIYLIPGFYYEKYINSISITNYLNPVLQYWIGKLLR